MARILENLGAQARLEARRIQRLDNSVETWVCNGNVVDREMCEQARGNGGCLITFHFQYDLSRPCVFDVAEFFNLFPLPRTAEDHSDLLLEPIHAREIPHASIKNKATLIDDHDPLANFLNIGHDMGSQNDRELSLSPSFLDEFPDFPRVGQIKGIGGLIKKDDFGVVEQGGGKLAALPLAEGKFALRDLQDIPDLGQLDEISSILLEHPVRDFVDDLAEVEVLLRRQVPEEPTSLPHDKANALQEILFPFERGEAHDLDGAGCGVQDPGEHL